jgi:hypothetical protein
VVDWAGLSIQRRLQHTCRGEGRRRRRSGGRAEVETCRHAQLMHLLGTGGLIV